MFEGKQALEREDYAEARQDFAAVARTQPTAGAYAFAATASYKMNDLPDAERFINEASRLDGRSTAGMRILGYKALILLREGRRTEGIDALNAYLSYSTYYPMRNYRAVADMARTGRVDLPRLERLIDSEVRRYESDMAEYYGEGTGYFAERYGAPYVRIVPD